LGLSEAVAYATIAVARKSAEVPALNDAVRAGTVSLSKASRMLSVMNAENGAEWIQKAATLSTRQLQREVAKINPRSTTPETASYVSESRLNLTLGVSEKLMLDLRRAQDQVSRSKARPVTLEETLEVVLTTYLKQKDPAARANRAVARKGIPTKRVERLCTYRVRTPIPAAIAHAIRFRDQGRCQFKRQGTDAICGERRFVDLHHIQPISQGGAHQPENLTTLCRAHHQLTHHHAST
jgi:hypothetical protein